MSGKLSAFTLLILLFVGWLYTFMLLYLPFCFDGFGILTLDAHADEQVDRLTVTLTLLLFNKIIILVVSGLANWQFK